jgi:large subunit ribosomal protein L21
MVDGRGQSQRLDTENTMYAIILADGKQFRVENGTVFDMDRVAAEPGSVLTLENQVLMLRDDAGVRIGTPVISGAKIELEVLKHLRGEKITVFKMKRRKRYRRKQGHRQELSRVKVKSIVVG